MVAAVSTRFTRKELKCLLLIGRSDKRELLPESKKIYGSNYGLAQARGRWVQERLPAELSQLTMIVLSSGPMNIGLRVSPDNMAMDRSVEVYTCGESRKSTEDKK